MPISPPEELNLLREGADFGWPACVGRRQPARGYSGAGSRARCAATEAPLQLWPAHAAPLQLLRVPDVHPSPWRGRLLAVWHGHRAVGHRVMAFALDARGLPTAAAEPLLAGWDAEPGRRPRGAPAGVALDHGGRLWVLEDRNRSLISLLPQP